MNCKKTMKMAEEKPADICQGCLLTFSGHGFPHLGANKSPGFKAFWAVVLICAFCGFGLHVGVMITKYFQYPYKEITRFDSHGARFPSITICNTVGTSTTHVESALPRTNDVLRRLQGLQIGTSQDIDEDFRNLILSRIESKEGLYANLGENERKNYGYTYDDMFLVCTYGGVRCEESMFQEIEIPGFFNCFTFSNEKSNQTLKTGYEMGLSLILFSETQVSNSYNLFSAIDNAYGMKIFVHETDAYPAVFDHSIDASPGFSTQIGLVQKRMVRLGEPHGECVESGSKHMDSDVIYTQHICTKLCMQNRINETCGCLSTKLPILNENEPTPFCLHYKENMMKIKFIKGILCELDIMETQDIIEETEMCGCLPSCDETSYSISVSQAKWPQASTIEDFFKSMFSSEGGGGLAKKFYHQVIQEKNSTLRALVEESLVSKHFHRVNVYLETLQVQEHREVNLLFNL